MPPYHYPKARYEQRKEYRTIVQVLLYIRKHDPGFLADFTKLVQASLEDAKQGNKSGTFEGPNFKACLEKLEKQSPERWQWFTEYHQKIKAEKEAKAGG